MKLYIKSITNRYQNILDRLVDGNKLWNPLTGEYDTLSEERLAELRNPKPVLEPCLKFSSAYTYKNGRLYDVSRAGEAPSGDRVYRNAGRYKIYMRSFSGSALPYSRLIVADTATGEVYTSEITQGMTDFRRDIAELVEWLQDGNTIE